jgi:hypothetical protein
MIVDYELKHLVIVTHMSITIFSISKVVTIVLVNTIFANFKNQPTTTNMASIHFIMEVES